MLLRFADLLAEHVRFEERELFEVAQARLDGNPIQI
jgi:hemerythrin-like domain-containing protein